MYSQWQSPSPSPSPVPPPSPVPLPPPKQIPQFQKKYIDVSNQSRLVKYLEEVMSSELDCLDFLIRFTPNTEDDEQFDKEAEELKNELYAMYTCAQGDGIQMKTPETEKRWLCLETMFRASLRFKDLRVILLSINRHVKTTHIDDLNFILEMITTGDRRKNCKLVEDILRIMAQQSNDSKKKEHLESMYFDTLKISKVFG